MGELYLVRHGETLFNVKNLMQGWCDSPLTEQGERQARRVGAWLRMRGLTFDHVYASTLTRTQRTLEIMGYDSYDCEDGLREWGFGLWEAERSMVSPSRPWGDFFVQFGGESQAQVRERILETLADIMSRPGHERVLAVSSGSICRELLAELKGDADGSRREVPGNCSIMRISFDGGRLALLEVIDGDAQERDLSRADL